MNDNRCLMCGEIIPEGRQVCPLCERRYAVSYTFALSAKKLFKAANAASIPPAPTAAGTYVLTVTVADGVSTYSWVAQS